MPGDRIEVELDYSELLVPEDATYELVYPTVVGPRYGGGADPEADRWIANPYLTEGEEGALPLRPEGPRRDRHRAQGAGLPVARGGRGLRGPNRADVRLEAAGGGNRDFVLRYRLAERADRDGRAAVAGRRPEREGFFAVMMEPPRRPPAAQIPFRASTCSCSTSRAR